MEEVNVKAALERFQSKATERGKMFWSSQGRAQLLGASLLLLGEPLLEKRFYSLHLMYKSSS